MLTGAEGQRGRALVQRLAEEGAKLWLVRKVQPDVDYVSQPGYEDSVIERIRFDVTDEIAVANFFDTKVCITGLDVLINDGGLGVFSPFRDRTIDEFDEIFDVNVTGA